MNFSIHPSPVRVAPFIEGVIPMRMVPSETAYDVHLVDGDSSKVVAMGLTLSDAHRIVEAWERVRTYVEPMLLSQRDLIKQAHARVEALASLLAASS